MEGLEGVLLVVAMLEETMVTLHGEDSVVRGVEATSEFSTLKYVGLGEPVCSWWVVNNVRRGRCDL